MPSAKPVEKKLIDQEAGRILSKIFGYDEFRPLQEECIRTILSGQDTVLLMPTGGGKSLCFQIPALIFQGLTLVVSPLISLMHDQVNQLRELGVEAAMLNSSLSLNEYRQTMDALRQGHIKILYMAPETLFKEESLQLLQDMDVALLAVDEAHCISEWGHDFRPEYRKLAKIRDVLPDVVCLALTATATPRVKEDILKNLELINPKELTASFNRINLIYEVIPKSKPLVQAVDFLNRFRGQSGIVYCFSRKQVDDLARNLVSQGFKALPYHAGLSDDERRTNQELFIRDDVQIIVATIAFGMGINKPNVRFVLHYDLPRNIESYYQETGRAGRDGLDSHCLLLFGYGDIQKIKFLVNQKSNPAEKRMALMHLNTMVHFAEAEVCRRIPLIRYFGEDYQIQSCGKCDNCLNPKSPDYDLTHFARQFLATMMRTGQRYGAGYVIDVLRGSKTMRVQQNEHNDLDVFGIGKSCTVRQWQFILRQLIQKEALRREDDKYGVLKFTPFSFQLLNGEGSLMGFAPPAESAKTSTKKRLDHAADYDTGLFEQLKRRRKELADSAGVPPYIIFSDKSLMDMSRRRPKNLDEFAGIFGVGEKKLQTYGEQFLRVISAAG